MQMKKLLKVCMILLVIVPVGNIKEKELAEMI